MAIVSIDQQAVSIQWPAGLWRIVFRNDSSTVSIQSVSNVTVTGRHDWGCRERDVSLTPTFMSPSSSSSSSSRKRNWRQSTSVPLVRRRFVWSAKRDAERRPQLPRLPLPLLLLLLNACRLNDSIAGAVVQQILQQYEQCAYILYHLYEPHWRSGGASVTVYNYGFDNNERHFIVFG